MPLITTHSYFAQDVLKKTSQKIKTNLENKQNIYILFAQGFDPFIFYEFGKIKKENIQSYCHINNTDIFFHIFIDLIKKHNLLNNENILAALYGHLTHYVLDSNVHPYIVYKTGLYDKDKPETLKYNGLHTKMEMNIDAYLYEQKNNKPFKNFKIHKYLITKEKFDDKLIKILNELYSQSFSIDKGGLKYQKGCLKMYYSYKFIIEDQTGIKRSIYHLIDKISKKKVGVFEYYNSHVKKIDESDLNLNHNTWLNPWDNTIISQESIIDLYNKAVNECLNLFQKTHEYLNDDITEDEYKRVLKDKSYVTGLSWHKKSEIKNLEF